jgi:hypothetical protein
MGMHADRKRSCAATKAGKDEEPDWITSTYEDGEETGRKIILSMDPLGPHSRELTRNQVLELVSLTFPGNSTAANL